MLFYTFEIVFIILFLNVLNSATCFLYMLESLNQHVILGQYFLWEYVSREDYYKKVSDKHSIYKSIYLTFNQSISKT